MAAAAGKMKGAYPERARQPECLYYLKTGTCKLGATCKFHHPKDNAFIAGRVQLNVLGYTLSPDGNGCTCYLDTGQSKFGGSCKFHHMWTSNARHSVDLLFLQCPLPSVKCFLSSMPPLAWILALRKAQDQACQVVVLEVVVLVEGVADVDFEEVVNVMEAASGSNLEWVMEVGPFVVGMKAVAAAGVGIADKIAAVQMPKEMDVDQVEEVVLQDA